MSPVDSSVSPLRSGRRSPDMASSPSGRLLRRLPPLVPRSYLCFTAPLGPAFAGYGFKSIRSPPPSAPPARPSLLPLLHRSARAGVRRIRLQVHQVASSVGSPRSSLAPTSASPLRSGRRTPDKASSPSGRLLRRLPPLVPRSYLCITAPLGPAYAGLPGYDGGCFEDVERQASAPDSRHDEE